MTEAEWLASTDFPAMLIHLRGELTPKEKESRTGLHSSAGVLAPGPARNTTPSRLRAFAAACLPRWRELPLDAASEAAINAYEAFLSGAGTHEAFRATCLSLHNRPADAPEPFLMSAWWDDTPYGVGQMTWNLETVYANYVARTEIAELTKNASEDDLWTWGFFGYHEIPLWRQTVEWLGQEFPPLLRETVGNPFRPVSADPCWLTSTVLSLVRAIHAGCLFERLPILADALEEAGCDNEDILSHLRGPGSHVPGCWAVDCLLARV